MHNNFIAQGNDIEFIEVITNKIKHMHLLLNVLNVKTLFQDFISTGGIMKPFYQKSTQRKTALLATGKLPML